MLNLSDLPRLKGFRFPRSVIGYAVWAYHRFAFSLRDVEDLLVARGCCHVNLSSAQKGNVFRSGDAFEIWAEYAHQLTA